MAEEVLVVALLVINVSWVFYLHYRDKRDANERRELMNRIAHPEILVEDKELVEAANEWTAEAVEHFADTTQMTEDERSEYAAVGRVDPDIRRDDGG